MSNKMYNKVYERTYDLFPIFRFLAHVDVIEFAWENTFKRDIQKKIDNLKRKHSEFINK